jgi:hypothetical protein
MEAQPHPQQPHFQPKTSGLAIASLVCGILGLICIPILPALLGLIFGIIAIRKINGSGGGVGGKGLAVGGLITSVIGVIIYVALFALMLLPALSKAKGKANRMKCANNLSTINKCYQSFATEIDGQTPHLYGGFSGLEGNKLAQSLGYSSTDDPYDTTRWMSAYEIRQSLYTPKYLASPLDPEAIAAQRRMGVHEFANGSPIQVASESQSYAIAMQGDLSAMETVLIMTRNIKTASDAKRRAWYQAKGGRNSGDIWSYPNGDRPWSKHVGAAHIQDGGMFGYAAQFHGEDGDENPQHTMAGMPAEEANWGTSDGAVRMGREMEFNDQLSRAQDSFREGNAVAPGLNLTVLRPQQ